MNNNRLSTLDALRGATVLSMVAYHFCFDWYILQGMNPGWRGIPAVHIWQQSICWTFLLLAGVSFHLGRHRWRNGLLLTGLGLLVTLVTVLAEPEEAIFWGVLNCHGASLLLAAALEPVLRRVPALPGGAACFALFALTYRVQVGLIALPGVVLCRLPAAFYTLPALAPLGFPAPGFYSSDYFPLLPWLFLYLTGYFIGKAAKFDQRPLPDQPWLCHKIPLLDWVGKHALLVYLVHQPVAMVVAELLAQ